MVNNLVPEWKHIPFLLITLRNFVLTPNQTHPTMTYGYEEPSPVGHAQVHKKAAAYGTNGQVRKTKDKNKSYARKKTRNR